MTPVWNVGTEHASRCSLVLRLVGGLCGRQGQFTGGSSACQPSPIRASISKRSQRCPDDHRGNIRNIAVNAAFLAAAEGAPVGMAHLQQAARSEYAKLDKPLTTAEIADWT